MSTSSLALDGQSPHEMLPSVSLGGGATATGMQQQHQQQQQHHLQTLPSAESDIRHSGRTHIRGKIRRIWRPRYLELCDNGLVRYYELPQTADVTMPDERYDAAHFNMILKDTLIIYHARIIDVTTLRDLHVGLPRGCYGFLFRGQRLFINDLLAPQQEPKTPREYFCAVSTLEEAQTWVIAMQWAADTCERHHFYQRQLSKDSMQQSASSSNIDNVYHHFDDSEDFVMTGSGSFGKCGITTPTATAAVTPSNTAPATSLSLSSSRWAKSSERVLVTKAYGYRIVQVVEEISVASSRPSYWDIAYQVALLLVTTKTTTASAAAATAATAAAASSAVEEPSQTQPTLSSQSHQSQPRSQTKVEERRILITAQKLQNLIQDIAEKDAKSRILKPFLEQLKQQAQNLPRFDLEQTSDYLCFQKAASAKLQSADDTIANLDGILRALAMEASAVNSISMKQAFGLDVDRPVLLKVDEEEDNNTDNSKKQKVKSWTQFWNDILGGAPPANVITLVRNAKDPAATSHQENVRNKTKAGSRSGRKVKTATTTPTLFRQVRQVPEGVNVDDYVREWLSQTHNRALRKKKTDQQRRKNEAQQWQQRARVFVEERPWLVVGGVGVAVAVLYPVSQVYLRHMGSTTMRVDVLAASWCLAYWLGQTRQDHHHQQEKRASLLAKKKRRQAQEQQRKLEFRSSLPPSQPISPSQLTTESYEVVKSQHSFPISPLSQSLPPTSIAATPVPVETDNMDTIEDEDGSDESALDGEDMDYLESDDVEAAANVGKLSSPIPHYPDNDGNTCWSEYPDPAIFRVRGASYLEDRVKIPSGPSPFKCRGVDVWMTDNPERNISRHPSVLGGKLKEEDTFLVNFLLPFGNFVAYFCVPPLKDFPNPQVASVWSKFINGDQQYRDARLKLLPVVMDGPWIVKVAVGNGTSPALLGKVIPLQYFFEHPSSENKKKGTYEVDVIITASSIAKGILSVVRSHTKSLTIAFALIIEAAQQEELPETVLCHFQIHSVNLDDCPHLPPAL